MTAVQIPSDLPLFEEAKGKVVILTGGSTGIGAATVRRLHSLGAFVNFLDVDKVNGEKLAQELGSNVNFYPGSVIAWADQLRIFEGTAAQYGRIDIVLANAGIDEVVEDAFADTVDAATGQLREPTLVVLDVTLRGVIFTAKLAFSFFRKLDVRGAAFVATGSAASYLDTAGIPVYNAAKHGVLGLVRSLRDTLAAEGRIRINLVAPAFVQTKFTQHLLHVWQREKLPINQPEDISNAIVFLALNRQYHGRAIYAAGGTFTEIEGPIEATRETWLGKQNNDWNNQRKAKSIKLGKQDD